MTALRCLYGSLSNLLPYSVVLLLAFSFCLIKTSGFTGGGPCKGHVETGIQSWGLTVRENRRKRRVPNQSPPIGRAGTPGRFRSETHSRRVHFVGPVSALGDGSATEEGERSIAGTRLRLGCRGSTLRRFAPHRGMPGDSFPLGSHAAVPPVARAAEKRPPPF